MINANNLILSQLIKHQPWQEKGLSLPLPGAAPAAPVDEAEKTELEEQLQAGSMATMGSNLFSPREHSFLPCKNFMCRSLEAN